MEKNFNKYGERWQYSFVKSLIETPGVYLEVSGYLKHDMFEDQGLSIVVKSLNEFYAKNNRTPTYNELEYSIKETKNDGDRNIAGIAFRKLKNKELEDGMSLASEQGVNIVKTLEWVRQLSNAKKSMESSGFAEERAIRIVEGLQNIGNQTVAEFETPITLYDRMISEASDVVVQTGISELDEHLNGGVHKGTTNLLLAGTGVGKTTLFSIMACRGCMLGHKVLYIYFEDKDTDFARKFYSNITGRLTNNFNTDSPYLQEAEDEVRSIFRNRPDIKEAFTNNLRMVRMPNGETTVDMIKAKVKSMAANGWKPDVVFIDYLSCLQSSTDKKLATTNEYVTLDRCMKRLDAFAQDENIALWVAQQFNREGCRFDSAYNRIGSVQGSYRVTQTASVILCLLRNTDDDDFNRINLYLDKSRFSPLASWEGAYMNNGTCQINLGYRDEPLFETKESNNNYIF